MADPRLHGDALSAMLVDDSLGSQRIELHYLDASLRQLAVDDVRSCRDETPVFDLACSDVQFAGRAFLFANSKAARF